jgi:hypothetical protein
MTSEIPEGEVRKLLVGEIFRARSEGNTDR